MSAEKRLKALGLDLGTVSQPVANYVNAVRTGNLLFLAGKGPRADATGKRPAGKVGREYSAEQAYQHARSAVGMGSLPMGIPVEIECIVEVAPAKKKRR